MSSPTRIATFEDGSQILIIDGGEHVAMRPDRWATWGPPAREVVEEDPMTGEHRSIL